jgi:hypothetical protein
MYFFLSDTISYIRRSSFFRRIAETECISASYFCNFNYDSEYKDKLEIFVS